MDKFSYISNAQTGAYVDELYQQYKSDPNSVEPSWRTFFEGFDFSLARYGSEGAALVDAVSTEKLHKELKVRTLIDAYRTRGHLESNTNPVRKRLDRKAMLGLETFGLSEADMDTVFEAGAEIGLGTATLRQILDRLRALYLGPIGFDYMSIRDPEVQSWFKYKIEVEYAQLRYSREEKRQILRKISDAVVFENFLHTRFVGQKRFSLEGGEATVAALDRLVQHSSELGVEEFVFGMAHRGRLNVLTNIMGKTYEQVFSEFQGYGQPDETLGSGDVKYHMGYTSQIITATGKKVTLYLAPNPSHLEAVNPVVMGYTRALIDSYHAGDWRKTLSVLIHGDAAVAGQGVVYECIQMSGLRGYNIGGTVHIIINNQVGFTTDFLDGRSSTYCTDIAQIIESPQIHVNGDDAEAVVFAVKLAAEYRQKFGKDVFVDIVCYRKHGHNESDEPRFTQPLLYRAIEKHPNPREVYIQKLKAEGSIDAAYAEQIEAEFRQILDQRLGEVKQKPREFVPPPLYRDWSKLRRAKQEDFERSPETGVPYAQLEQVARALLKVPEGFRAIKQIEKLLSEREEMFFGKKQINWAMGELLAYGTLMLEGHNVRFTGQDVERGTFSHRHAVLTDYENNQKYNCLNYLNGSATGQMYIYNSLLSEYAVLGYEFGYALANPNTLTIWEAQFGDFANGAQIMIDQFISSCESKWQVMNGLVMLLPHGYEGQGPEHSSARPERFLQLCAEYNMIVANLTTSANFFHFLRRQIKWPFRKPAVLLTPKSLLRLNYSPLEEFSKGRFCEVYDDSDADAAKIEKVLLCTGKIYYELLEYKRKNQRNDVAIVRIEQLHPFPENQVEAILDRYKKKKKLIWVQEEPVNMGYWTYILRTYYKRRDLELVARKPAAAPATGSTKTHLREQERIILAAFER